MDILALMLGVVMLVFTCGPILIFIGFLIYLACGMPPNRERGHPYDRK